MKAFLVSVTLVCGAPWTVAAQQVLVPPVIGTVEPYSYTSAVLSGPSSSLHVVDEHRLRRPGATFLQIEFKEVVLSPESVLEIEGKGGDKQLYEVDTWNPQVPHSVYFNGDEVTVRLWAVKGAVGDRFSIRSIAVGSQPGVEPLSICGATDDRVLSSRKAIARIIVRTSTTVTWCSAWLANVNNAFVTAGHCLSSPTLSLVTAQFNVPLSTSTGALVHPSAIDQFNWSGGGNWSYEDGGVGKDWGVFTTQQNSTTRRHASPHQLDHFRTSTSTPVNDNGWVQGFGSRTSPATYNAVGQYARGPLVSRVGDVLRYFIDTTSGNSGSVVMNSAGFAVGVHTHSGCTTSTTSSNVGTFLGQATFSAARAVLGSEPDLVVDRVTSSSTTLELGKSYTMSVTIRNAGAGSTHGGFDSAIMLARSSTISITDPILRSFPVSTLAGGGVYTYQSTVLVPTSAPNGTCYLAGYADQKQLIGERIESNNARSIAVTCTGKPDLIIESLNLSASPTWEGGSTTQATIVVKNQGGVAAPTSVVTLHINTSPQVVLDTYFLGGVAVEALGAGASTTKTLTFQHPWCYRAAGLWYVGAYADGYQTVSESNEANNGRSDPTGKNLSRYPGFNRFIEFTQVRAKSVGPYGKTSANFSLRAGTTAKICITSPTYNNWWVLPVWSRSSPPFVFDDLAMLTLQLPIYVPAIAKVSGGYADFTLQVPPVSTALTGFTAYTHTVWFTPVLVLSSLSGTNPRLSNLFVP